MDAEIIEKLMPLLPFIFMVFYFGVEGIEYKAMFGIMAAITSIFMSFEIVTSFNWLSLVYFCMGIGIALLLIVEYEKAIRKGGKK